MSEENVARTSESDGQNTSGTADGKEKMTDKGQKGAAKRERSSIAFPYVDLDDAVEVARAIHEHVGGGDCDDIQLSAWMTQSSKSSGFRMRLTAARMFGLLDPNADRRKLTSLGRMIVDPRQERGAKADAFLRVPLYSAIYERNKETVLPPEKTLETEIGSLGVAEKQKGLARQVFMRSAQQAGYFEQGKDRLIRPGVAPLEEQVPPPNRERTGSGGGDGGDGSKMPPLHPLIKGLIEVLPHDGAPWTVEDAAEWLQTAASNFRYAYKFKGHIKVETEGSH
jgi:hypothetical protein